MRKNSLISVLLVFGTVSCLVASGCGGDDDTEATSGGGKGGAGGMGGTNSGGGGTSSGGSNAGTSSGGVPAAGGEMGSPEPTGSTCAVADDCYAGLDTSELAGEPACIDKVEDGYCTHECETDDDCCAVEGECRTGFKQVCASFENTTVKYCFLSCEDADLVPAGGASAGGAAAVDATEYCEREANPRFECRSTGGGEENRKACLPGGGAAGAGGMGGVGGAAGMGGVGGVGDFGGMGGMGGG